MAAIDISSAGGGGSVSTGVLQLQNGVAMDSTLRSVTDQNNTASTLKLSTTSAQFTSPLRITTDDPSDFYLDCEDGSTNNRFSITRNTASQQVNLNFSSNPGGGSAIVGAIRTYVDDVNLSEIVQFREDGRIQIGSTSASAMYWDNTNNRLGIGTNAPTQVLDIVTTTQIPLKLSNNQTFVRTLYSNNSASGTFDFINNYFSFGGNNLVVGSSSNLNARLGVVGSGSTSATTSLLVQNSAGAELARYNDDGSISFGSKTSISTIGTINTGGNVYALGGASVQVTAAGNFRFVTASQIWNDADGTLRLSNWADNGFDLLRLGGKTASFPAIKRVSNNIEVKNANDTFGAGLSVGGALVASAILQADSTTQGFLPPRMTTAQKLAIGTPAAGLQVYDSTLNQMSYYNGTTWINF